MSYGVYRRYPQAPFTVARVRRGFVPGRTPGLISRAIETQTARALTPYRVTALGRVTESPSARALTAYHTVDLGRVTETLTAQALAASTGPGGTLVPDLTVEISFNVGASVSSYGVVDDPTRGIVDTSYVAAADVGQIGGVWTDVTDYVRSGVVRRGSTRVDSPIPVYEAGTCQIVLNNADRRFDPTNLDGPYVNNELSQVTPMRMLRVRAMWDDTTYDLFQGYIDLWDIAWDGPNYSEATVTATDAFKVLASNLRTATAATGAGEDTGARINRILTSAGWATADRTVSTGVVTVQDTTLDGDALAELQLTAKTEIGDLYVSGSGKVVFRSRSELTTAARSAISQATFGDAGDGNELPYTDLNIANDDATMYNKIKATRVGGAEQTASDADSITLYTEKTYDATDIVMQTDAQALTWAQYVLARSAQPELRFEQIEVDPRALPNRMYPVVLGADMSDRYTVVRRPPGGGAAINRDVWVRGIEHRFEPMKWRTVLVFAKADDGSAPPPAAAASASNTLRRWQVRSTRPATRLRRARTTAPIPAVRR